MFASAKLAVLFIAALSVVAMPSHVVRDSHVHREIAARVAQPEAAPVAQILARDMSAPAKRSTRRRRDGTNHCKQSDDGDVPSSTLKEDPKPTSTSSQEPPATPKEENTKPTNTPSQYGNPKDDPSPTTPTPTPTPTPSPTPDTGSGGGETYTGDGTYFSDGLGACGYTNKDSDLIAAVSELFFDSYPGYSGANPNNNPVCGKKAQVTYGGKTITVTLVDRCTGCAMHDLDFSTSAFQSLADLSVGRIHGMEWEIIG